MYTIKVADEPPGLGMSIFLIFPTGENFLLSWALNISKNPINCPRVSDITLTHSGHIKTWTFTGVLGVQWLGQCVILAGERLIRDTISPETNHIQQLMVYYKTTGKEFQLSRRGVVGEAYPVIDLNSTIKDTIYSGQPIALWVR